MTIDLSTARDLGEVEFLQALESVTSSAFRLETQPSYNEPSEVETLERFRAGNPLAPADDPEYREWLDEIRQRIGSGVHISRVRVQDEPLTEYQRWLEWAGRWNSEAGEDIRYLSRSKAVEIGLLPAAGDFWILDDRQVIVLHFDNEQRRIRNELVVDERRVQRAREWRDLAIRHTTA